MSLRSYGLKTWNAGLCHVRTSENLNSFKVINKCWNNNHVAKIQLQDTRLSQKQNYIFIDKILCSIKAL